MPHISIPIYVAAFLLIMMHSPNDMAATAVCFTKSPRDSGNYLLSQDVEPQGHCSPRCPHLLSAAHFFSFRHVARPCVRFVDPTDPKVSAAFHRRVEILSGHDKGSSGHSTDHDLDVEDPMENLLEIESGAGSVASPACYTCAIERPLRSRHCRNCRRCVRAFDHHCPFAGNCVGAANYRWFFSYVVTFVTRCVLLFQNGCGYTRRVLASGRHS